MPRKQRSVEEIIGKLREAEVALAQGETLGQACRRIGVSDHTFIVGGGSTADLKWTRRSDCVIWKGRTPVSGVRWPT